MTKWYDDQKLVSALPFRYRGYALYSRVFGSEKSRHVPGGSFLLRLVRDASSIVGASTIARVQGIDGLVVVTDFADERVLEVIHEIRGENPEYRVMQSLLSPGATFIDIGANFGTFSLLASRLVGPSGKVIAIEPNEMLAGMIEESAQLSGASNCETKRVAIGSEDRDASLLIPREDSGRAGLMPEFSARGEHRTQAVKMVTLDSLLPAITQPCMIKIDVEGSEIDVLDGGRQLIAEHRPSILIELNPWSQAAAGHSTLDVLERLRMWGYDSISTMTSFPESVDIESIDLGAQSNVLARSTAQPDF